MDNFATVVISITVDLDTMHPSLDAEKLKDSEYVEMLKDRILDVAAYTLDTSPPKSIIHDSNIPELID